MSDQIDAVEIVDGKPVRRPAEKRRGRKPKRSRLVETSGPVTVESIVHQCGGGLVAAVSVPPMPKEVA